MGLSTWTELKASIADFLNRQDLTAVIPDFITLAEAEMRRDLFLRGVLTQATATAVSESTGLPSNLLQLVDLRINDQTSYAPPTRLDPHEYNAARTPGEVGTPRCYTTVGGCLMMYPFPPDTGLEFQLTYYAKLDPLSGTVATNTILTNHPDLYLYGSLKQSAPYLRDDERVALWDGLYTRAKEAALIANERAEFGGSPLVIRPRRSIGGGRTSSGLIR